ncbi:MAG: cytochrome c oxidase assembly protein [Mycobacteriales bacterium]
MFAAAAGAAVGGYSGPPRVTVERLLGLWQFNPLVAASLLLALGCYAWGVLKLRQRGDRWSWGRTLPWVGGLLAVLYALSGAPGVYDDTLFSIHMVQHMLLSMVAPIGLALGAPATLALRTLPARPRGWLLAALHSRLVRVLSFSGTGLILLVGTLPVLLFTPLYGYSLTHSWFHDLVHVNFLLVGCVFFWPIIGLDPIPHRPPHWARLLVLIAMMPFHAFLGLALMASTRVIAASYYMSLHRPWGGSLLGDQHTGGGILWAAGDPIAFTLACIVLAQWMRAEERIAVRTDRAAERPDSDQAAAEAAWNAQFAALARQDRGP